MDAPETEEGGGAQADRRNQTRPGLFDGIAAVARDISALLFNRLELAALEFSEVRAALLKLLLIGALAIVALWFAVAYWTVLVVYLAWDALGWKILLIIALVFSLLAAALLHYARRMIAEGRLSMPATMAELRNDRDVLF
ncbi:MAG TPA: phage holin family protein [Paucimonas sp.]|nr:phage holin family protein [Paucimonas sp.]